MEERRIDWFTEIADRLRDYSEGEIWSSGNEYFVGRKVQ